MEEKLRGAKPPITFADIFERTNFPNGPDMAKVWEKCKPKMNIRKPFGIIMIFGTGGEMTSENSNFYKQMWDES